MRLSKKTSVLFGESVYFMQVQKYIAIKNIYNDNKYIFIRVNTFPCAMGLGGVDDLPDLSSWKDVPRQVDLTSIIPGEGTGQRFMGWSDGVRERI